MVIVGSQGGEMGSVLGGSISIEVHLSHQILDDDNDYYHDYDYDHDDHDDYHGLSVANMAIESCTAWRRVHLVKRHS